MSLSLSHVWFVSDFSMDVKCPVTLLLQIHPCMLIYVFVHTKHKLVKTNCVEHGLKLRWQVPPVSEEIHVIVQVPHCVLGIHFCYSCFKIIIDASFEIISHIVWFSLL